MPEITKKLLNFVKVMRTILVVPFFSGHGVLQIMALTNMHMLTTINCTLAGSQVMRICWSSVTCASSVQLYGVCDYCI